MKITFGMHLDGAEWSKKIAEIGVVRTGPNGLLSILESELGLSKPSIHPVHRIDAYMKRLEKIDSESACFHESFSVDAWSTSRQLLKWRDELIEGGWTGESSEMDSSRIKTLSALEKVDIPLAPGYSDRIRETINGLKQGLPLHIESICLIEPKSMLPPVWSDVISLLEEKKINISEYKGSEIQRQDKNISRIQGAIRGEKAQTPVSLEGDSVILLKADNEWEAAENLALWLSSKQDENDGVTIVCGGDTAVLDQALKGHGLPSLGREEPSRWREMQQILPLVFANAWAPVEINRLTELLSLTIAPFSKWVCRYLLQAIAEEPGVNGRAWKKALAKIKEKQEQELLDRGEDKAGKNADAFVLGIQSLLVNDRFDPIDGIPEEKLRERCEGVIALLAWRLENEPDLKEIVSLARGMQRVSEGKGRISRLTIERMLDTAIGI